MSQSNSILIEITGQTEFHLGNPSAPIAVDITLGYKRETAKKTKNEQTFLYASLEANKEEGINVQDVINACTRNSIEIPEILSAVFFKKFSVKYGKGGLDASEFTISFYCNININSKLFDAKIVINYSTEGGKKSFLFGGILHVDEHRFDLKFVKSDGTWYVYAAYINSSTTTINLRNIASKFFGDDVISEMPELSFTLEKFKTFLLYKKEAAASGLMLGIGAGVNVDIKDLPLAGPAISQDNSFAFKELLAIYSRGTFVKAELDLFQDIPAIDVTRGFTISTQIEINGIKEFYTLNNTREEKYPKVEKQLANKVTAVVPLAGAVSSKAKWKKLDKKIGPVTIQRIGFAYQDKKVVLLLDASMEMAGMAMQLMGFGLGFQLQWPPATPDFYLDGVGLSYKSSPIEISGAFLHSTTLYKDKIIDVYNGGAIIKIGSYSIAAIGSYAKADDEPSLFIYGVFDGPIGGPAFFFVTGIAAGFGYNRRVNTPSVDEVATFPLVALAMKPEEDSGLLPLIASLETPMKSGLKPIEISVGDYWLAIGIKFTSFKIIESFVLLTVNFGTQLEFAILGLSRLSWPEKSIAASPIVYIELGILAHFGPGSNVITVEAVITPNSYILSKQCKISGGFAFYTWIKGPHEGDFVITLGGYHPKFIKPAHYPTVPRLALSWQVSDALSIKGEMYYALTPSSIMAGGRWEVLFKMSIVKASIVLRADMLISWAPYQYFIDVEITVRIEADIKIWFIRIHFNFEMGAQLHIWGPDFAGEAYIDWSIFSFTIPFGTHSKQSPCKLTWEAFSLGFIPQKKASSLQEKQQQVKVNEGSASAPDPINLTISNGLIEVRGEHKFPVINPGQLTISADSFIPITKLMQDGIEIPENTLVTSASGNLQYSEREKNIGVRPCGFSPEKISFVMNVSVVLNNTKMSVTVHGIAKGVAEALWSGNESTNKNDDPGTSKVMDKVLTGFVITPPKLPQVSQIREFNFSELFDHSCRKFDWEFSLPKLGEPYHAFEVISHYDTKEKKKTLGVIERTYKETHQNREQLFSLLTDYFDETFESIDDDAIVATMVEDYDYFKATPVVCNIGQIPQYSTDVK